MSDVYEVVRQQHVVATADMALLLGITIRAAPPLQGWRFVDVLARLVQHLFIPFII